MTPFVSLICLSVATLALRCEWHVQIPELRLSSLGKTHSPVVWETGCEGTAPGTGW